MTTTPNHLLDKIELGMEHMTRSFDEDAGGLPWFDIRLRKGLPAYMEHFPCFDSSHVPGRCLDGLLMGEAATGIKAPDRAINTYRKFLFESFNAADGLNGYIDPETNRRTILFHNFREGLLALHALVRWRNDAEARLIADRMLEVIHGISRPDGEWNTEKLDLLREKADLSFSDVPTGTTGRFVSPLVKYYRLTGNSLALTLAERFAEHALRVCFHEDGTLTDKAGQHVHSITSTISSLAEYYWQSHDLAKLDRVKRIYDNSLRSWRSSFGWVKELIGFEHMGGEGNSTGDLIQTALIFAKAGYKGAYGEAERMLRGHLIPSQVISERQIDPQWVVQLDNPTADKWKDIALRMRGGFGFPTPNDRAPIHYDNDYIRITTLDITGGSVQALCEAYSEAVTESDTEIRVHLLFDREAGELQFRHLDFPNGKYYIASKLGKDISIRIPNGTLKEEIRLEQSTPAVQVHVKGEYVRLSAVAPFETVLTMPNKVSSLEENLLGHTYKSDWRGDHLVSLSPKGTISPMFP